MSLTSATIDLSNATVLPGLIDMHVHLTGDPEAQGYKNLAASVPRNALFGAANGRRTLHAGFTTARNVGAGGYADVALRDAINNGDVAGPRLRVAAHAPMGPGRSRRKFAKMPSSVPT
jgi:imidazolonepropionase-like amidohydrolase